MHCHVSDKIRYVPVRVETRLAPSNQIFLGKDKTRTTRKAERQERDTDNGVRRSISGNIKVQQ